MMAELKEGILTRAADLVYTFRFLKLLVTPWNKMKAFELGIIDENGKRDKKVKVAGNDMKSAYTPFHRLVFSVKRFIGMAPGGKTRIGSYIAALLLLKDNYKIREDGLLKITEEVGLEPLDFLSEGSQWFLLDDKMLTPGRYKICNDTILASSYEPMVNAKDTLIAEPNAYPKGEVFGIDVYELTHEATNQKVYCTISELYK
tara:strand:+ start:3249 stop:3854 length:606 start_codon:yes stop_codon:yes gene_type:complete